MEKTLRRMFDYQRFEGNMALNQVINGVHARYVRELSLDELETVAAAGEPAKPDYMKDKK
jgi:hypothetical protein